MAVKRKLLSPEFLRIVGSFGAKSFRKPSQIDAALASNNAVWIYTKDPSVQACTDLMNRALDKPAEQKKVTGSEDGPVEVIYRWEI